MGTIRTAAFAAIACAAMLAAPARAQDEGLRERLAGLQEQAEAALVAGRPAEAVPLYEQLFTDLAGLQAPDDATRQFELHNRYNYACALSLSGDKEKAIEALTRSIELGFEDWKHIEQDKDLDPIRAEEGFKRAIEAGKARNPRLPLDPFAKATLGDWCAFTGPVKIEGQEKQLVLVWRTTRVEEGAIGVSVAQQVESEVNTRSVEFERGRPPTIRAWAGIEAAHEISKVTSEPSTCTVAGKEFACTKLTFQVSSGKQTAQYSVFLAPDLPPPGRVLESMLIQEGEKTVGEVRLELAGYGNGDTVTWGKRPEDLGK